MSNEEFENILEPADSWSVFDPFIDDDAYDPGPSTRLSWVEPPLGPPYFSVNLLYDILGGKTGAIFQHLGRLGISKPHHREEAWATITLRNPTRNPGNIKRFHEAAINWIDQWRHLVLQYQLGDRRACFLKRFDRFSYLAPGYESMPVLEEDPLSSHYSHERLKHTHQDSFALTLVLLCAFDPFDDSAVYPFDDRDFESVDMLLPKLAFPWTAKDIKGSDKVIRPGESELMIRERRHRGFRGLGQLHSQIIDRFIKPSE